MIFGRKCAGCGKDIPADHCALGVGDKSICMRCEGKSIKAYKVECGGDAYIGQDFNGVTSLLAGIDIGDEYTISVVEMSLAKYLSLPEFQGF